MNLFIRIFVISLVVIVSDIYFYKLLKNLIIRNEKGKKILKYIAISFTLIFFLFEAGCYIVVGSPLDDPIKYRELFAPLSAFILVYMPKAVSALFLMLYDLIYFISSKIHFDKKVKKEKKRHIWVYITALVILLTVLGYCIYGFVYEKTHVKIQKVELYFSKLPEAFDGFRIVQISDTHLGTFKNTIFYKNNIEIIRQLSPDMLVMTGDMINVTDKELEPYYSLFRSIDPPYGKYSILGNHDIGDYFKLKTPANIDDITKKLIQGERNMGFTVLIDSACYIIKDNDSIALIGVNNCGIFPFKHTGNLTKAMKNTADSDFKILLSHDPGHWLREVSGKTNVDLTLSGHTHAMQFGFVSKKIKFSPSWIIYKEWMGLYSSGEQKLYVNPGLGYSGFSGRIGIRPEITLITLHHSK
jgi:uncharacterized protein